MIGHEFSDFYEAEYPRLLRACALMANDQELAKDAVIAAFVKVSSKWDRGELRDPSAYVHVVALNETRRILRRERIRREVELRRHRLTAVRTTEGGQPDEDPGHAQVAGSAELRHLLAELPWKQRAVVVLRHAIDLPEREVAELLNMPLGSVKSAHSRAMASLRAKLERERDSDHEPSQP